MRSSKRFMQIPELHPAQNAQRARVSNGLGIVLALVVGLHVNLAEAKTTARVLPSGEGIELVSETGGVTYKDTIPVYKSGGLRYFSAGVDRVGSFSTHYDSNPPHLLRQRPLPG